MFFFKFYIGWIAWHLRCIWKWKKDAFANTSDQGGEQGRVTLNETRENVVYMVIISHSFHHPYPWINYGTKNVNIEWKSVSATETQMVSGWWPSVFFIQSSSKFVIASTYSHPPTLPGCRDHRSRVRVFVTRLHDGIMYICIATWVSFFFFWASIGLISQLWTKLIHIRQERE